MSEKEKSIEYLNSGQARLLVKVDKFLDNKSNCLIITGAAGTGKTYMIKLIAEMFDRHERSFHLCSPTGRAAKVLSEVTKYKATTIHNMIYTQDSYEICEDMDEENNKVLINFSVKKNNDPSNSVYIFDEASMISDQLNDNDYLLFGSGRLLHDLVLYTGVGSENNTRKLIFVGDKYQLPPINSNYSVVLETSYLKEHYKLVSEYYELEDIVRHATDSGILENATVLRTALVNNSFSELQIIPFKDVIIEDVPNNIVEEYCKKSPLDNPVIDSLIITYRNATALEYNKSVKEKFNLKDELCINDRIIVVKNRYTGEIELLNGEMGFIENLISPIEHRRIPLSVKENETGRIIIDLYFQDVVINCDTDSTSKKVTCKALLNLLDSSLGVASGDLVKALYVDFKMRNGKIKDKSALLLQLMHDEYFNAVQIKYAYAITCHKAQGGEWKNVFVDFSTHNSFSYHNLFYFKWIYTAITRCKGKLTCLNPPVVNRFNNAKINSDTNMSIESQSDSWIQLASTYYENGSFEDVINFITVLNNHRVLDFTQIQDGYTIKIIDTEKDDISQINIYCNKENTISSIIQCNTKNSNFMQIEYLNQLIGFSLDIVDSKEILPNHSFLNEISYKIYLEVRKRIEINNIVIKAIAHNLWSDNYTLIQNCQLMKVNINYNKKGCISNITYKSQPITPELLAIFLQLKDGI